VGHGEGGEGAPSGVPGSRDPKTPTTWTTRSPFKERAGASWRPFHARPIAQKTQRFRRIADSLDLFFQSARQRLRNASARRPVSNCEWRESNSPETAQADFKAGASLLLSCHRRQREKRKRAPAFPEHFFEGSTRRQSSLSSIGSNEISQARAQGKQARNLATMTAVRGDPTLGLSGKSKEACRLLFGSQARKPLAGTSLAPFAPDARPRHSRNQNPNNRTKKVSFRAKKLRDSITTTKTRVPFQM